MRFVAIIVISAAAAVAGFALPAAAQSQYCLPLQMELAELERSSPGSTGDTREVREALAKAKAQERNAGCRRFFSRNRSGDTCRSLRSRISQLERQLSGSRRGSFFGFSRSPQDRQRDRIRAALSRAGCSERATTYRTICVRACDGYYFPLSITSSRQRFQQDAEKCLSQYPPGEATLFYHPFPGGDASQAVSLSGERYFDQPTAFTFQSTFIRSCAVQLHEGLAALRERLLVASPTTPGDQFEMAATQRMATLSVPIPMPRAEWSSDPETLANREGGLAPRLHTGPAKAVPIAGGGTGRIVGDPYFFADANPGPPATVAGYKPPELKDYRVPQRAAILPVAR